MRLNTNGQEQSPSNQSLKPARFARVLALTPLESAGKSRFSRLRERFVADGESNWWRSPEGRDLRQEIETEVRSRYRAVFQDARWYRQILLEFRMRQEIKAEVEKATPPEVLWVKE